MRLIMGPILNIANNVGSVLKTSCGVGAIGGAIGGVAKGNIQGVITGALTGAVVGAVYQANEKNIQPDSEPYTVILYNVSSLVFRHSASLVANAIFANSTIGQAAGFTFVCAASTIGGVCLTNKLLGDPIKFDDFVKLGTANVIYNASLDIACDKCFEGSLYRLCRV